MYVCEGEHIPLHTCGGQKTFRSFFFPSSLGSVDQLRFSGLHKWSYSLSHPLGPICLHSFYDLAELSFYLRIFCKNILMYLYLYQNFVLFKCLEARLSHKRKCACFIYVYYISLGTWCFLEQLCHFVLPPPIPTYIITNSHTSQVSRVLF